MYKKSVRRERERDREREIGREREREIGREREREIERERERERESLYVGEEKQSDAWINEEMAYLSVEMIFQVIIRIHQRFRINRGMDRLISWQ